MAEQLYEWDQSAFFAINHGLHHPWLDPPMWLLTSLGLGWVQLLLLFLWALKPWALRRRWREEVRLVSKRFLAERVRLLLIPGLLAFAGSGITVQVLKHLWNRPRPSTLWGALVAPDEQIFAHSFPSGHTATAFALALFLWYVLRDTRWRWVGWLLVGLAALVGLSRIYRGLHYPSDVLAASLIGVLWGLAAIILRAKKQVAGKI